MNQFNPGAWRRAFFPALFVALFFCASFFIDQSGALAQDESGFTVSGVTVDETAENAVVARDQAMIKARRQALVMLAERTLDPEAFKAFTPPDDTVISTMIRDFEVQDERVSATRYMASMTFRFAPGAVAGLLKIDGERLENVGAGYSALIVPVRASTGGNLLWEEGNAWLAAWKRAPRRNLALAIHAPAGDVMDSEAVSADAVLSGDRDIIGKLTARYGVSEAVIAIAAGGDGQEPLKIDIYQFVAGELAHTRTLDVPAADAGGGIEGLMDQAVRQVGDFLNAQQLARTPGAASGRLEVAARAAFTSPAEWAEIQRRLDRVAGLEKSVVSLGQSEAGLSLSWRGDETTLRDLMAQNGLSLGAPVQAEAENGGDGNAVAYEIRLNATGAQ